jgi:hypothetical protein
MVVSFGVGPVVGSLVMCPQSRPDAALPSVMRLTDLSGLPVGSTMWA